MQLGMSPFYDLGLSAVIGVALDQKPKVMTKKYIENGLIEGNYQSISYPLKYDDKKFKCIRKRRRTMIK